MENIILQVICLLYVINISYFYFLDKKGNDDVFSGVKLLCYFSIVDLFVMSWFAFVPNSIERAIFSEVHSKYHDFQFVIQSYIYTLLIFNVLFLFVKIGEASVRFSLIGSFIKKISDFRRLDGYFSIFLLFFLGVLIYLLFLFEIGGLYNLWLHISMRTTLTAGLGYLQASYTFLITVSYIFLYVKIKNSKKGNFKLLLFTIITFFILLSLGQRAPVVAIIFALFLVHNYKISKIKSVFTSKIFFTFIIIISFMFAFVQLRPGGEKENLIENIESSVIQRLGNIERKLVVIGYFYDNPYWYDGVYASLIYAAIPRGFFPEKPPVDTGVYVKEISSGRIISPPLSVNDVDVTSWPDGFLAGYMSFGILGLVALCALSGWFYGLVYGLVKDTKRLEIIFIYSSISFMGVMPLNTMGIVKILLLMAMYVIMYIFFNLYFRLKIK